jgi:hypothetical protein
MRTPPLRSIIRVVVLPRTTPSATVILVDIPSPLITKLLRFIDGFIVELLQLLLEDSSHVA